MDDAERCHICCEVLRLENVAIAVLPCGHKFHASCALQHSLLAADGDVGFCSQCCESAVTECDSIATIEQDHSEQKPAKLVYDNTLHAAGLVKGAKYMMAWQGETYSVVEVASQPLRGRADRVNLRLINMRIVASRQDMDHVSVSIDDAKSSLTPVDETNVNRVFETVCADANILRLFDADANSLVGRLVRRQARPKAKYAMLVVSGAADDGTHRAVTPTRCEDARAWRRAGATVGTDWASADAISARAKVRITLYFGKPRVITRSERTARRHVRRCDAFLSPRQRREGVAARILPSRAHTQGAGGSGQMEDQMSDVDVVVGRGAQHRILRRRGRAASYPEASRPAR